MNNLKIRIASYSIIFCFCFASCEDFVEIGSPEDKISSEAVFGSDEMAYSAMTGIYNQLMIASFSNGWSSSVTFLAGLSGDNLEPIRTTNLPLMEFEEHELSPTNAANYALWSSAYNIIYLSNSLLEGLENSDQISVDTRSQLEGEAKFIRAFAYFYLVNLYGEVPLVLTTDYQENELLSRNSEEVVYKQIVEDLNSSIGLLGTEYPEGERTRVNKYAAMAFLARVYLYLEDWKLAEELSSQVITHSTKYAILEDPDEVFLANSREAIWQISPLGRGNAATHTNEGDLFIIDPFFHFLANFKLENNFVDAFEEEDERLLNWIGFSDALDANYVFKYKIGTSTDLPVKEYSMVLRFAEQYLIRAEARAAQGKLSEAVEDINIIRLRAGLNVLEETEGDLDQETLLDIILEERRKELFGEWGHRWLDLKRTGRAGEVFNESPFWQPTDILYPVPGEERMKNPNLSQNDGY